MATVVLFAAARQAAGHDRLDAAGPTVADALGRLGDDLAADRRAELRRVMEHATVLVDGEPVGSERLGATPAGPATEIAVLPPFAGGSDDRTPGTARMADVADKPETARSATAECRLVGDERAVARLLAGEVAKGDAVAVAEVAGVQAAKRTHEALPLCHPVRVTSARVRCRAAGPGEVVVRATVRGVDRTGFEMEALHAAGVAALALYDMGKPEDPALRITDLRLLAKDGGGSGAWRRPDGPPDPDGGS